MFRTTAFAAILLAFTSPAAAVEEDTQVWLTSAAEVPLANSLAVSVDASQRFRSSAAGDDLQLLRVGLQYEAADWLLLGGGIAYVAGNSADETRLFQSVTLRTGRLLFRSQLEERFFDGAARPQLRGRQRVQLTVPLDDNDRIQPYVELNYILQHQDPMLDNRVDHWRLKMDWRHKFTSRLELSAAYTALLAPRPNAPDRLSHVPSLSVMYSF